MILGHLTNKADLLLIRPPLRPLEESPIRRPQDPPTKRTKSLGDPTRMPDDLIRSLLMITRAIERIDDIPLNAREMRGMLEMLAKGRAGDVRPIPLGEGGVEVRVRDGQRSTEEDGGAAVVDEDGPPESVPEFAFGWGEGRALFRGVVVQAEFDGEADEVAYEAPAGSTVALKASMSEELKAS